ncbi:sugar O-acetyltransferase [Arsenicicoccus dermatophilus]|uniref:sugar O-acetyltransferase n=1 Tax=Arsenicicoccus dermatophilus TaxID=1076331 RepID=UPI001F4CE5CA|nr:sugar O-acetyltransferase [Arsenicicoccus dermatophilus]
MTNAQPTNPVEPRTSSAEPGAAVDPHDGRTMRERRDAGDLYRVDEELGGLLRRATELVERANALPSDSPERREVLTELLGTYAEGAHLRAPVYVDYGDNLHVGAGTFANFGLVALDVAPVRIGERVQIGPGVQLLTATHPLDPVARGEGWEAAEPITIEDDVWLGGGALVLAGVTVGRGSVVGAGAVVTKDVPPGVVVVGNPARVVRTV